MQQQSHHLSCCILVSALQGGEHFVLEALHARRWAHRRHVLPHVHVSVASRLLRTRASGTQCTRVDCAYRNGREGICTEVAHLHSRDLGLEAALQVIVAHHLKSATTSQHPRPRRRRPPESRMLCARLSGTLSARSCSGSAELKKRRRGKHRIIPPLLL